VSVADSMWSSVGVCRTKVCVVGRLVIILQLTLIGWNGNVSMVDP
jgi:hypothetical protein